jgi:hypothetical protein
MLVPDTVNVLELEAVPYVVLIDDKLPETPMLGATKVIVEVFLHLTVAEFDVVTGIKYKTNEVFGAMVTLPLNVLELVEV